MKYYMAPLEEVTEAIYRNAYHAFFFPMDKYFAPFISAKPNKGRLFNYREKRNILPENNQNLNLVPQILTNQSEDFLRTVKGLMEYGYKEVNLNLGCPSRPVVNGGRGSGFLEKKEELKQFLDEIFEKCPIKISIKTRLGRYHEEEIEELFELFSNYPYEELIVHPRVQTDYYKGNPRLDAFAGIYQKNEKPLIYNGDIFTKEDYEKYDLILGMDRANISNILRIIGSDPQEKVHRLLDFTELPRDIADPWYTGDFEITYAEIKAGCAALLKHLRRF